MGQAQQRKWAGRVRRVRAVVKQGKQELAGVLRTRYTGTDRRRQQYERARSAAGPMRGRPEW